MSKGKKRSGARPGRPQPLRGSKGKRKGARLWYVGGLFFSSRRRHTSFDCDWSSDVCSSDLSATTAEGSFCLLADTLTALAAGPRICARSEERRVGKECRSRWSKRQ